MKTLWNIIAVIAIANMLALLGVVAFLRATDRLNIDRARDVRAMFARTVSQDRLDAEAKQKQAELDAKQAEEAAKAARSPLTAAETLAARAEATDLDRQRTERLKREISDLQAALMRERAKLETDRRSLQQAQQAFAAEQARIAETTGTEQFERSLGVLASLKAPQARSVLEEIMRGTQTTPPALAMNPDGSVNVDADPAQPSAPAAQPGNDRGKRLAVEYLNAMDERARAKIMAEFAKDAPAVAAELLELLRMRGRIEMPAASSLATGAN